MDPKYDPNNLTLDTYDYKEWFKKTLAKYQLMYHPCYY